jgi:hypothetical protein
MGWCFLSWSGSEKDKWRAFCKYGNEFSCSIKCLETISSDYTAGCLLSSAQPHRVSVNTLMLNLI